MTPGSLRDDVPERFPGFRVLAQAGAWDDVTRAVVLSRVGPQPPLRFFTEVEAAAATALFDRLLDQHPGDRVPVTALVDTRLADGETDGWHYDTMPPDEEAWRRSLAALDDAAREVYGAAFADCGQEQQSHLLAHVKDGAGPWRGFDRAQLWSLWTRYACTAFYSHPDAWNEIGFAGPAYPRGYKNLGVDRLEPFEVKDARPGDMPRVEAHE